MTERASEWRRGWTIVLAASLGYGTSTLHTSSLGAMVKPVSAAFGWNRADIAGALLFLPVFGLISFPLIGRLADRIGSRRILLPGLVLYAGAISLIGLTGPTIWSWYAAWALLALVFCLMSTNVWASPVVGRFTRSRGMALGAMLCGSGIANTVIPPLAVYVTQEHGWRSAYWMMGAIALFVTLPVTFFLFKDAPRAAPQAADAAAPARPGMSIAEAARTQRFWKLCFSLMCAGGVVTALQVHMQPLMIDRGVDALAAAAMMAAFGPALIFGRFGVGFLLDHVHGSIVACVALTMPAVSMLLMLNFDGAMWQGVLAAALLGLSYGAEVDLMAYLGSRYFGLKNYSAIYGMLLAALTLGLGFAPGVIGFAYDRVGSYDPLLVAMIVLTLVAAVTAATLGKYPAEYHHGGH